MAENIIRIEAVNKTFGSGDTAVAALKDINIDIEKGSIYGIIGLSGAGKSTLVRCINLLEKPDSGHVYINGNDLMTMSERELRAERKNISMIFQGFNLLMQRTVLKNICFPMELAGVKRAAAEKRAMELLEIVGLTEKAGAYPVQLSGGQKQRVAIARALASDPQVLLCDEATSALDPQTTQAILNLLRDINRRLGVTVVIITHEMRVVEQICTNVTILDHGVIQESGSVEDVFTNPRSEIGRRLILREEAVTQAVPASRQIRIIFNGTAADRPIISEVGAKRGIMLNIHGASTRTIAGRAYGEMLVDLPAEEEAAKDAIAYLGAIEGLTIEEVSDDVQ